MEPSVIPTENVGAGDTGEIIIIPSAVAETLPCGDELGSQTQNDDNRHEQVSKSVKVLN